MSDIKRCDSCDEYFCDDCDWEVIQSCEICDEWFCTSCRNPQAGRDDHICRECDVPGVEESTAPIRRCEHTEDLFGAKPTSKIG